MYSCGVESAAAPPSRVIFIRFVTESLTRGGMETLLVNMANALTKRGFQITILCYDSRDDLKADLDKSIRYIYRPRREFEFMNRIPHVRRYYNYRKAAWEHRVSARALYKYYVGKENYDIEIGFYRGPSIKIISGSTNKNSKKFAWVHTDLRLCNPKGLMGWFNNQDEIKTAYESMDCVVCVSDKARESLHEVIGCKDKSRTIYNMIPSDKIIKKSYEQCPLKKDKFTFITVGRFVPDKCQDRVLTAAKRLNDKGYDFDIWIVGGGTFKDYEKQMKEYCKDNKIHNVVFVGPQVNPYTYMRKADLFVLPSKREGFAIVIPEAMACGLPVLSTKCTGPTEILNDGEYGILVSNDEEGIYQGMKSVLDSKDCIDYYRQQSLKRYHRFDENVIIEEIIKLFEQ